MCHLFHHDDPYLRIGPFFLEMKQYSPQIILIQNFVFATEASRLLNKSQGNLVVDEDMSKMLKNSKYVVSV